MPLNIPLPDAPGEGLLKGIRTGSDMFAKIMNAKYNGSLHPSGDVANALYVEQMKNQYGENDPRYLEAKRAHEMALSGHQSLMDYRNSLNQTAGIRATSPLGKLIAEGKGKGAMDILNGGGNQTKAPPGARYKEGEQYYNDQGEPVYDDNPRSPQERKAYEQAIGKGTTDAAIRDKIPYAKNVKITMDNIDPKALVQYSGPQGTAKYYMDSLKAAMGNPPPEFMDYQKQLTGTKTLSKQLRQFWGDSIQPSATDKIDQLTNPSTWNKDPQVALQQFNQLKQITDQELQTFQDAGTSPVKLNYDDKSGSFFTSANEKAAKAEEKGADKAIDAENDQLLAQYVPELIKINPKYTAENVKHTAKEMKLSIGQVIDQLMAKGK